MNEYQYLKTWVKHPESGKVWFISTINRYVGSVDDYSDSLMSETMVWEWDTINDKRGKPISEVGGCKGSIINHIQAINQLVSDGNLEDE